jgi:AraC-like DNA-binding protein
LRSIKETKEMKLVTDLKKLEEIMQAFYTLTGIRFIIFDSDYNEVIAYPQKNCEFCQMMKDHPVAGQNCRASDARAFKECNKSGELIVYNCHAGLIEATIPLKENGSIIGYVMFGQITDQKDKETFHAQVLGACRDYNLRSEDILQNIKHIKYKSRNHIVAASRILETCTCYMLLKEMITPKSDKIVTEAKHYIEEHLSEDIDIREMCNRLNVSRTRLYEIFSDNCKTGVGNYIRNVRLERAKQLLKGTDMSIADIADAVGFSDYNYFSRVYKAHFGKSPKTYRRLK